MRGIKRRSSIPVATKALLANKNLALKTGIHVKGVINLELGVGVTFLRVMKLSLEVEGFRMKHLDGGMGKGGVGGRRKGAAWRIRTE